MVVGAGGVSDGKVLLTTTVITLDWPSLPAASKDLT